MLIYIHGFNSAPESFKARLTGERLRALGRENEYFVPALPHRPAEAMALLCAAVEKNPHAALIGSSLGGYYATYLAERYALRAVLVNPAVKPHALLRNHLGPQKNLYTGASYELTAQHVTELEVLDYRDAVEKYSGAMQRVIPGGDHGFGDFADYLDEALAFCGMSPRFP